MRLPLPVLANSGRGAGLRENCAQLAALVEQPWTLLGFTHFPVLADFHPQLTFVGLFEDDSKPGGELCVRSTAAGAAVIACDSKAGSCKLAGDRVARGRARK